MRYVMGLETVRAKAREWEEHAARHVSLAPLLAPLTQLYIEWRKLELSSVSLLVIYSLSFISLLVLCPLTVLIRFTFLIFPVAPNDIFFKLT